ncbi:MAG: hypothetical protein ACE5IQ_04870 [Candidatus Methylomirabilales bacterium]
MNAAKHPKRRGLDHGMIFLEQVPSDLVVACWLRAELFSPRFRPGVVNALRHLHLPRRAIERPNLNSRRENRLRREALHLHREDTWGILPPQTQWWRAAITAREFRQLRVINYPTWTLLAGDTGRLSVAAAAVARETVPPQAKGRWAHEAQAVIIHVLEMREQGQRAELQSGLILLGDPRGKTWTILEGNKRATALYIRCLLTKTEPFPSSIHVLVGLTSDPCPCLRTA